MVKRTTFEITRHNLMLPLDLPNPQNITYDFYRIDDVQMSKMNLKPSPFADNFTLEEPAAQPTFALAGLFLLS